MKIAVLTLTATLLAGTAIAQTTGTGTAGTPGNTAPGATSVTPMPGVNPSTGTTPDTGVVGRNSGTAAASGDRNQAVTTTGQDALEPASGANSFSEGQARGRIEDKGFTNVTGLTKDDNGVWRGTATKDGSSAQVWLDYKGNVGQAGGMRPAASTGTTGSTTMGTTGTGTSGATGMSTTTGTSTNPPGTAAGRAADQAAGTNATGTNPGATNPPGTAVGRAVDRAAGTNATGTNPAGSNATPR